MMKAMDTIRIALTKGRIEQKATELFEGLGYDMTPLRNKGRKLEIELPGTGLSFIMAKAPDVITYVERGVCDMGVVGKDTILENGGAFYEMADLGFGVCRFALAAKAGTDPLSGYQTKVIASKYPNVTRAYFEHKNMDVDIVKIEGSVELAPLLGLADAIVDIVETGGTLKANGLEVVEDIAPISSRLIVNAVSLKLKKQGIEQIIEGIERQVEPCSI